MYDFSYIFKSIAQSDVPRLKDTAVKRKLTVKYNAESKTAFPEMNWNKIIKFVFMSVNMFRAEKNASMV